MQFRAYDRFRLKNLNAIDSYLRKILTSEDIKVLGDDFLVFDSLETYDLIQMNPRPKMEIKIYLYNVWKSNKGYKINKRFILIFRHANSNKYFSYGCKTKLRLDDIEKVFTYFNNGITPEISLYQSYVDWFENRRPDNYHENSLFKVRVYKKDTMHFYVKMTYC